MPKTCGKCDFYETYRDMVTGEAIFECKRKATVVEHPFTQRDKNCPLVEIPTPYGRLVDATFEENHYASMLLDSTPDVTEQDKHNARIIIDALHMARTVIEAEGSEI